MRLSFKIFNKTKSDLILIIKLTDCKKTKYIDVSKTCTPTRKLCSRFTNLQLNVLLI